MKTLKEMTFVDKGHVLAGLFPELLKEWIDFIKNETEYLEVRKNITEIIGKVKLLYRSVFGTI